MPLPRLLIADSQVLVADALAGSLRSRGPFSILSDRPTSGLETLDVAARKRPDVAVIDYWLDDVHAPWVLRALEATNIDCKVLCMAWLFGVREITNAMEAGAVGFLPKSIRLTQLVRAIRQAAAGRRPVYAQELQDLMGALSVRAASVDQIWERLKKLSRRELHVLALLSLGRSTKEMSIILSLTPKTVSNYVQNMFAKTGARSSAELLTMARNCGLIAG